MLCCVSLCVNTSLGRHAAVSAQSPDASLLGCANNRMLDWAQVEHVNHIIHKIPLGTCAHVFGVPQPGAVLQVLSDSQVLMHNVILQIMLSSVETCTIKTLQHCQCCGSWSKHFSQLLCIWVPREAWDCGKKEPYCARSLRLLRSSVPYVQSRRRSTD